MAYLLSLLSSKSSDQTLRQSLLPILCYYINSTTDIQIVRVMDEAKLHFERVVFPAERVLFETFPESYLEIHSPFPDGDRTTRSECRFFQINER
ncbi:DUF1830 domain-containing protein [Nodosilinea nodulosa]|uniref:DUF1830 domain-containing protein n=1 Tax=Nodosilinea nodulosa TaxID=416001 RepID=UPI0008FB94F8